jgi:hypothetical protein
LHITVYSRSLVLMLAAIAIAACRSGDANAPDRNLSPIRIVTGAGVTDTIESAPAQALIVQVGAQGGQPLEGAVVRFETFFPGLGNGNAIAYVGGLASVGIGTFAVDTTDADGFAKVRIKFGTIAGNARVLITVPETAAQDTARFTVLPGKAARVVLTKSDTSIVKGAQYQIGASAADRKGNARPNDPVTYRAGVSTITVDASGTVTGVDYGRAFVLVSAGNASDTAWTSVVPSGTIAIWRRSTLGLIGTDASNARTLTTSSDGSLFPQWKPDGSGVVIYEGSPDYGSWISTVSLNGTRQRLIDPSAALAAASFARYSPDGAWLYFNGVVAGHTSIWRAHSDGTAIEEIAATNPAALLSAPSVSPSGSVLAYEDLNGHIALVDLSTRAVTRLSNVGSMPVFSPDGSQIAYISATQGSGALVMMAADGSSVRAVSAPGHTYSVLGGLSWSPDGTWLLGVDASGMIEIVRPSDGLAMQLKSIGGVVQASWGNR